LSVYNTNFYCRLALGNGVVDLGTYARQRRSTSSSSSSRSRQSQDDQIDKTLQHHEEWMQYIIMMIKEKYLQLCNFSNFIQILLNHILNDFLEQGYTPYSSPQPPPFPCPTTPGDTSTHTSIARMLMKLLFCIQARISIIKHA
jgi:hypothetical protein